MQSFYSHGKLLLTGEYVILDGALGLAIPTKKGQSLHVKPLDVSRLIWKSIAADGTLWFEDSFDIEHLHSTQSNSAIGNVLLDILRVAKRLNPGFLLNTQGYEITTTLEFPRDWGLGSSSTLINNIADWAKVDPYKLLKNTFGGSGYDIACAQHSHPITYQLQKNTPKVSHVSFYPMFSEALYFVHLNKKQDSRKGISRYASKKKKDTSVIDTVSTITNNILRCSSLSDFDLLINEHEQLISKLIDQPTIKKQYFHDFSGSIKSLGAWGGDFVLATAKENPTLYFKGKGYATVLPFKDMILE